MREIPHESPITTAAAEEAVREWFALLGRYCAAVDYESAEAIFAPDVLSFGTKARVVGGVKHLRENQWQGIWPNISDFSIEMEQVRGGGDSQFAWGLATWTSTVFDREGKPFFRPGRATVALERRNGGWVAVHSHFSVAPGTPPETFGPGGSKS